MKYKVIGYTSYDNEEIKPEYCNYSAIEAIIEDLRVNDYLFSGENHEYFSHCAPVLNDGKKRLFSPRSFGRLMANAKGECGYYGHCGYDFTIFEENELRLPEKERWLDTKRDLESLIELDLQEEFTLLVDKDQLDKARDEGTISFPQRDELRFMDKGDSLTLVCEDEKEVFLIEAYDKDDYYEDFCDPYSKPETTVTVTLKRKGN